MAVSTQDNFHAGELVAVLTTRPINRTLNYFSPEGGCQRGSFVEILLGSRTHFGVVWGKGRGDYNPRKIRKVIRVYDIPPMQDELRQFLIAASQYTLTPLPAMLRLVTQGSRLSEPHPMQKIYRLGDRQPDRLTEARKKVLSLFNDDAERSFGRQEIRDVTNVTSSVVKKLVELGALIEDDIPRDRPFPRLDVNLPGKDLAADQVAAAQFLSEKLSEDTYCTTLLHGVTGSGKTEVYLEAISEVIRQKKQVLVLLPEIILTGDFLNRIKARFGVYPAEWHSGATAAERRRIWHMVCREKVQLVVGARSALFLPFANLGLIVVDEEHDTSYKQEDGVLYNARDMSVLRAAIGGGRVVLSSATPSLESWANAKSGKYHFLELTTRFGEAVLPTIRAIDMRTEKRESKRWISPSLCLEIKKRLQVGEQALLFVNRRGYAPVTLCRACGHQIGCSACDARMTEHRLSNRLMCHQCGETMPIPDSCPSCGAKGQLVPIGPGVERLAEEVEDRFPEARVATLSSDMFQSPDDLKAAIRTISEGGVDIVVGTQLVAKGHNFPLLTLVGVIDVDLGLQGSDLRASERTFQLMRQVAGRAGRVDKPGEAYLQTYQPDHPVIRAILSGNDADYWAAESYDRKAAGAPPFGRFVAIVLSGRDYDSVQEAGYRLKRNSENLRPSNTEVYGPVLAPIARIRGRHRFRLLVKAPKDVPIQNAIRRWVESVDLKRDIRLSVDVDPQSFL